MEEGMKEIKAILIGVAVLVISWVIISSIRITAASYAMENLKTASDQAINNMTKRAQENNERMKKEFEERLKKDAEIKRQREEEIKKEALEKERVKREVSPECQFWKLQDKNRKTERTETKIKEYCSNT